MAVARSAVAIPPAWSASARALNVASVRPAIGRVKTRSTNAAKSGTRGRKSWSIDTRVRSSPVGSIRHVTSIPRVAPATWTKRSRERPGLGPGARLPGDRQAESEDVDQRPPRHEADDERAIRPAVDPPRAHVVRQQPLPAFDVPGEREDELGPRRISMSIVLRTGSAPLTGRAGRRGSADRARDRPGRGRPSRDPSSHEPPARAATRRAAYSNSDGRPRNAWTSHDTASLARNRRCIARS